MLLAILAQSAYPLLALLISFDFSSVWLISGFLLGGMCVQIGAAIHAFVTARRMAPFQAHWWSRWYGLLGVFALYLAFAVASALSYEDPIKSFNIPADSMQPNVRSGERLVAVGLYGKPLARGEVVVFANSAQGGQDFIKRIVAIAGDSIELRNNRLWINDREVSRGSSEALELNLLRFDVVDEVLGDRKYSVLTRHGSDPRTASFARRIVPDGHVFMLGDNRDNSYDSRLFGPVKVEDVHWRAAFIFWSRDWDRIGLDLRKGL